MLLTIAFSALLLSATPPLSCPIMGSPAAKSTSFVEYAGSRYGFCCPGCDTTFKKDPATAIAKQTKAGKTTGEFLFDPVSRNILPSLTGAKFVDFKGTRYRFETEANSAVFKKDSAKFAAVPAKEALYCPVMKGPIASYGKASDYADYEGVRYFFCCPGCQSKFTAGPKAFLTPDLKSKIRTLSVSTTIPEPFAKVVAPTEITVAKFGQYEARLRIPEDGLFAQEEVDVEFRVVDTTQKDPVEEGFKGVGGISASAIMTMPSMQGMPEARPNVHREGVPGDYGIELFFPHGGDYKIDLTLKVPNVGERKITFMVDVKDERTGADAKVQPFRLDVIDWPATATAGQPSQLNLKVVNTKTGATHTSFDVAHEMKFHLLIASKDLNWFLHEHPEMKPDGTWTIPMNFPAGGDYWIYGDVAPSGKGSRVLIAKVTVNGAKPTWDTTLRLATTAKDGGLRGELSTLEPTEVGRKAVVQVKIFDDATGKPATDTVKWLGAAGHMMIFHRDGQTVVHSHPAEDAESEALVKDGIMRFTGRFPRAGTYKVYAQFDWRGAIRTLGFTIEVK